MVSGADDLESISGGGVDVGEPSDGLRPRVDTKLPERVFEVGAHGASGDEQLGSDLPVGHARADDALIPPA